MGNDLVKTHSLDKLRERKEKYRLLIALINKGHSYSSAARKVGYSPKHVCALVKKPYFKRKLLDSEEIIKGNVKASLVKRALGYDKRETKVIITKNGPEEIEEIKHYPGDVKAQLAYLSAKDKEGGWSQGSTMNLQINQQLQGVSSEDLLLTLRHAGGEGGVVMIDEEKKQITTPTTSPMPSSNAYEDPRAIYRGYAEQLAPREEPYEGMLENVGEDVYPDGGEGSQREDE